METLSITFNTSLAQFCLGCRPVKKNCGPEDKMKNFVPNPLCILPILLTTICYLFNFASSSTSTSASAAFCSERFNGSFVPPRTCLVGLGVRCSTHLRGFTVQCGVENSECRNSACACKEGNFVESADRQTCTEVQPSTNYGEACDRREKFCFPPLRCSGGGEEGLCGCRPPGAWAPNESICHDDEYCRAQLSSGAAFYDARTDGCKCLLGSQLCHSAAAAKRGISDDSLCPANSKLVLDHENANAEWGSCTCDGGFKPNFHSYACIRILQYGEKCEQSDIEADDPCNNAVAVNRVYCINGSCQCHNYNNDIWNVQSSTCTRRAGDSCHFPSECTSNAVCSRGFCRCREGYQAAASSDPEGTCLGAYGSACLWPDDCGDSLDCIDGHCKCRSAIGQIYYAASQGESKSKCLSLVGSSCTSTNERRQRQGQGSREQNTTTTFSCVPFAYCNSTSGTCECPTGYTPAANNGRCIKTLTYGESCQPSECDPSKGLACVNRKCKCMDLDLKFDTSHTRCVAKIGGKCGTRTIQVQNSCLRREPAVPSANCEYYSIGCESGLVCKASGGGETVCAVAAEGEVAPSAGK